MDVDIQVLAQSNSLYALLKHKFKNPWSAEQDEQLRHQVQQFGARNWCTIAKSIPGRNGKQCRDRWLNHLSPQVNKQSWRSDEEWRLYLLHQIYPSKWTKIASFLPGRTENNVKNKWHCLRKGRLEGFEARLSQGLREGGLYGGGPVQHDREAKSFIKRLLRASPRKPAQPVSKQEEFEALINLSASLGPLTPVKGGGEKVDLGLALQSAGRVLFCETTVSSRKFHSPGRRKDETDRAAQFARLQLQGQEGQLYFTPIKAQYSTFREASDSKSMFSISFNQIK